jgi:hypothetical protein
MDRRILVKRELGAPLVIVIQERSKRASKGPLIPHDDMIETLFASGPDQALDIRALPGGKAVSLFYRQPRAGHDNGGLPQIQAVRIPE